MGTVRLRRSDILRYRFHQHQLDRPADSVASVADIAILDLGVQDTGTGGFSWALVNRGAPSKRGEDVALAWTIRGAPHAYRRVDLPGIVTATAPYGEADAAKRIFDAAKPLKAANISVLDALRTVADHMRAIVHAPTSKGDVSGALTKALEPAYLRFCGPCDTTHIFEMPFRLAALQAGLELEAETSPPVLRRITGLRAPNYRRLADEAPSQFDVIHNYLRFYGPARARDVAAYVDAPVKEIQARWPTDAVEVVVDGAAGGHPCVRGSIDTPASTARAVRLLGPFDPYLQLRDRELLVPDKAEREELWRVLGRPGAIAADGHILGTWRPKASGRKLTIELNPWSALKPRDRTLVADEAERLAAHRQVELTRLVGA